LCFPCVPNERLQAGECVLALRTALAELPATAHFTAYKLLLRHARAPPPDAEAAGAGAGVAAAPALWEVNPDGCVELNDVLELQEYAAAGLEDGCTVVRARVWAKEPLCVTPISLSFLLASFLSRNLCVCSTCAVDLPLLLPFSESVRVSCVFRGLCPPVPCLLLLLRISESHLQAMSRAPYDARAARVHLKRLNSLLQVSLAPGDALRLRLLLASLLDLSSPGKSIYP
jgi:hypothetical protein